MATSKCGVVQPEKLEVRVSVPHVVCVPIVADRRQESREVRAGSFFGLRQQAPIIGYPITGKELSQ